jgi:hypothetical protein
MTASLPRVSQVNVTSRAQSKQSQRPLEQPATSPGLLEFVAPQRAEIAKTMYGCGVPSGSKTIFPAPRSTPVPRLDETRYER